MKLIDLKVRLSRHKYIALNGIRSPDTFIKAINVLFNDHSLQVTSGNDFSSSTVDSLKSDMKTTMMVDMTHNSEEEIAQVFSVVRDLQSKVPDEKIIFFGDWSHKKVRSIINLRGISYPFTQENNELYTNRIRFSNEDFNLVRTVRSFDQMETWKILLDFTKGEIFSTAFFFDKLQDFESLSNFYDFFRQHSFNLYQEYKCYEFYYKVKDILCEGSIISSFLCRSEESENIINRSNIFEHISSKGSRGIYIPINYFAKYILKLLCDENQKAFEPSSPIIFKETEVMSGVMEIERTVKHLFSQQDDHFPGKGLLHLLPLYSSIIDYDRTRDANPIGSVDVTNSSPTLRLTTGELLLDQSLIEAKKVWGDEQAPQDFLSILTFGQLIRLLKIYRTTFYINRRINLTRDIQCKVQSVNHEQSVSIDEQTLKNGLYLNKKDILSICGVRSETKLNIILHWSPDSGGKYYLVRCKQLMKNFIKQQNEGSVTYICDQVDTQQIPLFQHFEDFVIKLEEVKKYRNAISHMKVLSKDAHLRFFYLEKELYGLMAKQG